MTEHAPRDAQSSLQAAPSALTVLMVGSFEHDEFAPAVAELRRRCELLLAGDAETALELLRRRDEPPALILLAQARPGEMPAADVERLRREAPLARVVGLLGSWQQGETRSGSPLPGVIRVYWRQWKRLLPELEALESGRMSSWSLPVTATDEERLLWSSTSPTPQLHGLAAVASADYSFAQWLADACRACGLATAQVSAQAPFGVQGADWVLWDVRGDESWQTAELAALRATFPDSRIVALVGFPRWEDQHRLLEGGAAAVLAKPLTVDDLYWELEASAERAEDGES